MLDLPIDTVREHFNLNAFGALRVCQAVIPHMAGRTGSQRKGVIINIGSIVGEVYVQSSMRLGGKGTDMWATQAAAVAWRILRIQGRPAGHDRGLGHGVQAAERSRHARRTRRGEPTFCYFL